MVYGGRAQNASNGATVMGIAANDFSMFSDGAP